MTDIVYVLGTGSPWQDNELRFSLRSLETYLQGVGTVYLVGERPKWITNVVHLPFKDLYTCKERNIMLKLAYACGHPDLSETFLHVHDDHFALGYSEASEIPNWCGGSLDKMAQAVSKGNHWRDAVQNTHNALKARGHTTHNFDLHYPMLFNKNLYPEIMDRYDWNAERGYVVKSLYANTIGAPWVRSGDLKLNDRRYNFQQFVDRLRGRPWYSLGNGGLNNNLKKLFPALYPNPSKFELM